MPPNLVVANRVTEEFSGPEPGSSCAVTKKFRPIYGRVSMSAAETSAEGCDFATAGESVAACTGRSSIDLTVKDEARTGI